MEKQVPILFPMSTKHRSIESFGPVANQKAPNCFFQVCVMGREARNALSSKSQWRVLAVFQRSIYFQNSKGDLVCLGPKDFGAGPLNVLCELPPKTNWLSKGIGSESTVTCDDRFLSVDARFWFSLGRSTVWKPPAPSSEWSFETLDQGLKIIAAEAKRRCRRDGFASLIPIITELPYTPEDIGTPLSCMAWKPVASLFDWLKKDIAQEKNNSSVSIRRELETLIGLGPGLTPSGDDLMGGVLIALHTTDQKDTAVKLAEELLPMARNRTNIISFAHLASAASGEGNAAVHRVLSTITGRKTQHLAESLSSMDTVGHSSGWDAVSGLVLVLRVYVELYSNKRQGYRVKTDKAA